MDILRLPSKGKFKGIKPYYKTHPEYKPGKDESSPFVIGLPEVDQYSGSIKSTTHPCLYVVDSLNLSDQTHEGLRVLDAHGHIEDGVWMAQNKKIAEGKVDVIELVKEVYANGHEVDMLLICSEIALGYEVREPPNDYYKLLDEKGIVYARPFEQTIPRLQMTPKGNLKGYVTGFRHKDEDTFINLEKLQSRVD